MRKRIPLKPKHTIRDIELECVSQLNPEVYNVLLQGKTIGCLRLLHGNFTVRYPNSEGALLWEGFPEGQSTLTDLERPLYLKIAKQKLLEHHNMEHKNGTGTNV